MLQVCFLNKPPFGVCGGSPLPEALPPPGPQWPQRSLLIVPTLTCPCHPPPSTFRHRRGWNPVPVFLGEETSPFPQYPVPSAGRGRAPLGMGFPLYLALGCVLCCNHPTSAKDKSSSHLNKHLHEAPTLGQLCGCGRGGSLPPGRASTLALWLMPASSLHITQATHTPGLLPRDPHIPPGD